MSDIKTQLTNDMKSAMKEKAKDRLSTLRMTLAALKQKEVDLQVEQLADEEAVSVIDKMIKQRKESAYQYQQANRPELAQKELEEIEVLKPYLPKPLTSDEIRQLAKNAIHELDAQSMQDMGKVMANLRPKLIGRVDMGQVSTIVKSLLS